jgi:uncharacterized membrane protein
MEMLDPLNWRSAWVPLTLLLLIMAMAVYFGRFARR